jgi:4-amino-4-deoxy-L-arabinose transferase-like glycosyltransferase
MDGPLEWVAAVGSIVAAALIAADLGRKVTGWAFVLFSAVSLLWVTSGLINNTWSLVIQNALLLAINGWGLWQYLLSPAKKREIEKQNELARQAKRDVAAEDGQAA